MKIEKLLFWLAVLIGGTALGVTHPFGPGSYLFSPDDSMDEIHRITEEVFKKQHHAQFGTDRYAFLFLPGDYTAAKTIQIGYYTQILGLGKTPDAVKLGNVKTPAALPKNNATCNFWVGIENVQIVDTDNNADPYFAFQWGVSQAAPARRLLVERKSAFDWFHGWASGGYVADTVFKKPAGSYSQQQYYYRNNHFAQGDYGVNWNKVIQGCTGQTGETNWRAGKPTTVLGAVELIREKPFLFHSAAKKGGGGAFKVFVPALRKNAMGPSWKPGEMGAGKVLDVAKDFFVAKPEMKVKELNAALAAGKHLLFTPGIYHVTEPIRVLRADTVLLGIGEATIVPENDFEALYCADVDGVTVAGLIFDAERESQCFVMMGTKNPKATRKRHADNPSMLIDTVYRVGGTGKPGKTAVALEINSHDVIVDHTWIWRADHGAHTGWTANTAESGLVVNGDHVTCYGLFVEHFQEYDVLWNGEYGRTFFLQNEKCYDPPGNDNWKSHGGKKLGYAAYKVADHVKHHHAIGLGIYDVFIHTNGRSVFLEDAIEVPDAPDVVIENACIVEIANANGPKVGIHHIVNGQGHGIRTGKDSGGGYAVQRVYRYADGKAECAPNAYKNKK